MSTIDLYLVASMLRDLALYLEEGSYDGIQVVRENYDTCVIFKSLKICCDDIDTDTLRQLLGERASMELLYRLARSAILKHGRNVEGWLFLDEGASAEEWFFFMKPNSRAVYAMIYEEAVETGVFYRISRNGIEELSVEKLRRLFGNKVFKVFPDIFAMEISFPEEIFLDKTMSCRMESVDFVGETSIEVLNNVSLMYVEELKKDPSTLRKWLLGVPVYVPTQHDVYREVRKLCLVNPLIRCAEAEKGYIYVRPEYVARKHPEIFRKLKEVAGVKVSVVDVIEKLKKLELEEPIPLKQLSMMLGDDVEPFLPYLANEGYLYIFKTSKQIFVYK